MEASGPTLERKSPGLASGTDEETIAYRSVSVLALVGLIAGVASPLCLAAPLLWVIPLAGVTIALAALRQIAASDGAMIGRAAALVGLALSVASMGAAVSRSVVSEQMLSGQARAAARQWLELLQEGDVQSAFELTVESTRGPAPPAPPGAPGAPAEPPADPVEQFRTHPIVGHMTTHGAHATIRYLGDSAFQAGARGETRIVQQFDVDCAEHTHGEAPDDAHQPGEDHTREHPVSTVALALTMQRVPATSQNPGRWLVADFRSDALPPTYDSADHTGHHHPH